MYDFIVIDGPPTLGLLVVNILCAVDGVLYPFVPDSFSQQGLKNIQQVLEDIREMEICPVPRNLGYIPNLFDARRKQVHADFEKIGADLGSGRMFVPFTNRVQFTKAQASRKSVFEFQASEFKEIQDQFMNMAQTVQQELLS
jgi:chromosome partitioning protein